MINEAIVFVTTMRLSHPMLFVTIVSLFLYLLSKEVLKGGEDD